MIEQFDPNRVAEIQKALQVRDTEDLLETWRAHDESEWAPEAFEAMRLILKERLGQDPSLVQKEYYCSACGTRVLEADTFCPACGANLEAEEQSDDESSSSEQSGRVLTELALTFFAEASQLPEEYAGYFTLSDDDEMVIPARFPRIGDLRVHLSDMEITVEIGDHTDIHFRSGSDAAHFIRNVLEGRTVFTFDNDEVELHQLDDLTDAERMEWDNYIWSGPLRNQQTGVDWHQP